MGGKTVKSRQWNSQLWFYPSLPPQQGGKKSYARREGWHNIKLEIMNYALRHKFTQHFYQLFEEYVMSDIPI